MTKSHIKVIVMRPGKGIKTETIENTLDAKKAIIGGWLERVILTDEWDLVIDEEGMLKGLPGTMKFIGSCDTVHLEKGQIIVGNCFLVKRLGSNWISLEKDDVAKALRFLMLNFYFPVNSEETV